MQPAFLTFGVILFYWQITGLSPMAHTRATWNLSNSPAAVLGSTDLSPGCRSSQKPTYVLKSAVSSEMASEEPLGGCATTDKMIIKARFRCQSFHEPNLIHWIRYMKSAASDSIRKACFFSPSTAGNFAFGVTLVWLWFRHRTFHVYSNIFCKQFDRNEHFSPFELSSAAIKIGVRINLASLNNLGQP